MKILYAVHGYKPAYKIGGPIISVSAAAEVLVKKGHKVTVFTTNSNLTEDLDVLVDQPTDVNGVEVWYFKREEPLKKYLPFISYLSKSIGFLYAPKMRSALDLLLPKVDIVHTHLPFIYPTYAAGNAAIRHGKPLFYSQRGVFDPERLKFRSWKKHLYISLVEKSLLKRATTLISLTEAEIASYRALGVNTPIEVIPNGITVEDYWQELPEDWNERIGIDRNAQVILFMGRLHPIKGVNLLIKAFLSIKEMFPKAVLVLAGPDDFGLKDKFRDEIKAAPGVSNVIFSGMITGDMKKALLTRADIFCLPSDAEGFSIAVLEAMASKTAVLISPGCHFPSVESAYAGKIIPPSVDNLALALSTLLTDKKCLKVMGENGYHLVKTEYNWDRIINMLISVYNEGISRKKQ